MLLRQCMASLEFAQTEQHQVFQIVAATLHLGNLTFAGTEDGANVRERDCVTQDIFLNKKRRAFQFS